MSRARRVFCAAALPLVLATAIPALAQSAPAAMPAFDVVSIKPYGPDDMMIGIRSTADGIAVTGMPMHMILREAFGVSNDRLIGEPAWVNTARFDVDAKVAAEDAAKFKAITERQRWAMLLPALEDRCELKIHHETREALVYTLIVARGGIKMQPSSPAPAGAKANPRRSEMSADSKGITLVGHKADITAIVRAVSLAIGSTVVDKTGLTGTYDYRLEYAPESRAGMPAMHTPDVGPSAPPEISGPSIFTAVQEQLGLKLEAKKEKVDVIVIDHIEQPAPN